MFNYIALHGKTWYESKFHAKIEDDTIRQLYEDRKRVLNDSEAKAMFNVKRLQIQDAHISKSDQDRVVKEFDSAATFAEFFRNLRLEFAEDYCVVTYRWVDQFVSNVVFRGVVNNFTRWTIPLDAVRRVEFTVAPAADMPKDDLVFEGGGMQSGDGREDLMNWYHASGTGGLDAFYGWALPW